MAKDPEDGLLFEVGVSINAKRRHYLQIATKCFSTSQSQYIRQALDARLIHDGIMPHPLADVSDGVMAASNSGT